MLRVVPDTEGFTYINSLNPNNPPLNEKVDSERWRNQPEVTQRVSGRGRAQIQAGWPQSPCADPVCPAASADIPEGPIKKPEKKWR